MHQYSRIVDVVSDVVEGKSVGVNISKPVLGKHLQFAEANTSEGKNKLNASEQYNWDPFNTGTHLQIAQSKLQVQITPHNEIKVFIPCQKLCLRG